MAEERAIEILYKETDAERVTNKLLGRGSFIHNGIKFIIGLGKSGKLTVLKKIKLNEK